MTSILIVDDSYTTRLKTELVLRHVGRYRVQSPVMAIWQYGWHTPTHQMQSCSMLRWLG